VVAYLIYRSPAAFGDTTGAFRAAVGIRTDFSDTTLAYGSFHYVVFAKDTFGLLSVASNEAAATAPDHLAPPAPGPLAGTAPAGEADLAWPPSAASDVLRYRVHADTAAAPTTIVDSTATGADTTIVIHGLTSGTFYHFRLSAIDSSGNVSAFSNEIILQPGGAFPGPPAPAESLVAVPSPAADRGIDLTWLPSTSGDVNHYRVYRDTVAVADTTGRFRATVGLVPALADTVPSYRVFHYVVFAVDDSGEVSAASNDAFARSPDHLAPTAPGALAAVAGPHDVTLAWGRVHDADVRRYRVYAGTSPAPSTAVDSTTSAADTSVVVENLEAGTLYHFRVTAIDSSGNESSPSLETTATPLGLTPDVTSSFFPNPAVAGAFEIVVVSTINLANAPIVRLALLPDTTGHAITMLPVAGSTGVFHGFGDVSTSGTYHLTTAATTTEGVVSHTSRDVNATMSAPGESARLVSPDGFATLTIGARTFTAPTLLIAETIPAPGGANGASGANGAAVESPGANGADGAPATGSLAWRFTAPTASLGTTGSLVIHYDGTVVHQAGKLEIEEWIAGSWATIPTRVYTTRSTAEAAIDHLGTYRLRENPDATGDNTVPVIFLVRPGYPNPFHPATTIAYELPDDRAVTMSIFDTTGRRVVELVRDVEPAGRHAVTWAGRDDRGERVASGIYFCRVEAGRDHRVLKLTLIR